MQRLLLKGLCNVYNQSLTDKFLMITILCVIACVTYEKYEIFNEILRDLEGDSRDSCNDV